MDKKSAVIQLQEKFEKAQEGYVNAITDFINSYAKLVQPFFICGQQRNVT